MKNTKSKRWAILAIAALLCVSMLTACGGTSLLGMLDQVNSKGATPGNAYYAASYGNAYYATSGDAFATSGNAYYATSGNAVASSGNAVATSGNAVATSGNAVAPTSVAVG